MGLFDGILGDSSKSSTGNPPADDASSVLVTDTATLVEPALPLDTNQTSTPPQVDAFLNMSAGDITAEMPSYTERKAMGESVETSMFASEVVSDDASAILVNEESAVVEQELPATSDLLAEVQEMPQAPENLNNSTTEDVSSILFSEMPEVVVEAVKMEEKGEEKVDESPVFDAFGFSNEAEEVAPEAEEIVAEAEETTASTDGLFAFESTEVEEKEEISAKSEEIPTSTLDFLAAGIAQLDAMEKSLQDKKTAFLAQAEEYRTEKEKFAELEKNALADSRSMNDEQERISAMRKYFETQQKKQKDGAEITDSVKTALTGISVQNAVGNTMKSKSRAKKAVTA